MADPSLLEETTLLAKGISAAHELLDVHLNNAGVYKTGARTLAEGRGERFAANTLAPVILTKVPLPVIPNTGRVRHQTSAA